MTVVSEHHPGERPPRGFSSTVRSSPSSSAHHHGDGTRADPMLYPQQSPTSTVGTPRRSPQELPPTPEGQPPAAAGAPEKVGWGEHGLMGAPGPCSKTPIQPSDIHGGGHSLGTAPGDHGAPPRATSPRWGRAGKAGRIAPPLSLTLQRGRKLLHFFLLFKLPANTSIQGLGEPQRTGPVGSEPPTPQQP